MTTDVVDSTNVNPLQPLSSFNFNAEHNGVKCIASLAPEDRGTERQFWWTVSGFVGVFDESERTIRNNIASLVQDEEVSEKNFRDAQILDSNGVPHPVTLYNLEVLNKLGMCCFRGNKKAKEIRNAFNDVLVKHETNTQPTTPQTYLEALKALVASEEAKEVARLALMAEQEAHERDNRDYSEGLSILESKKAEIGSRREAKAMATASAKSRECARLAEENDELKDAVGRGANWRTVSMMKAEWVREFGHTPVWQKLKQFSQDVCIDPVKDVEERVILKDGSEKVTIVNRYHREAWYRYRKYEENLRVTDTEILGV